MEGAIIYTSHALVMLSSENNVSFASLIPVKLDTQVKCKCCSIDTLMERNQPA